MPSPEFRIARNVPPPTDLASIVEMLLTPEPPGTPGSRISRRSRVKEPASRLQPSHATVTPRTLVKTLTIVGGKGGVGKSTVACALAIGAVDADGLRTLLVSTDPAASLADALGAQSADWARKDVECELADPHGLVVRQMDATSAFARLRDEYQVRIDQLFSAMVGRGVGLDIERDRAIVRDLLALAPPGIDELYALSILGDTLEDQRFDRIVVDPAPTGHLLRLLDMPAVALDWSHRLMRLMLQYKEIVSLGESAQELLNFAKRTRALESLLHDSDRCGVVVVSLDEPVVRTETERLVAEVQGRGIETTGVIWNRVRGTAVPLPLPPSVRQVCAEEVTPPPVGTAALRGWSQRWTTLSTKL